jgi:hypothetical protein
MSVSTIPGAALKSANVSDQTAVPIGPATPAVVVRRVPLAALAAAPLSRSEPRISMSQVSPMSDAVREVTLDFRAGSMLPHIRTEPIQEEEPADAQQFTFAIVSRSAAAIEGQGREAIRVQANFDAQSVRTLLQD